MFLLLVPISVISFTSGQKRILRGTNSGDLLPSGVKIPGDETSAGVEFPGVEQKLLSPSSDEAESSGRRSRGTASDAIGWPAANGDGERELMGGGKGTSSSSSSSSSRSVVITGKVTEADAEAVNVNVGTLVQTDNADDSSTLDSRDEEHGTKTAERSASTTAVTVPPGSAAVPRPSPREVTVTSEDSSGERRPPHAVEAYPLEELGMWAGDLGRLAAVIGS